MIKLIEGQSKLRGEIKDLEQRIKKDKNIINFLEKDVVVDSVACGKKGKKPLRTVKIVGRPTVELERRKILLTERVKRCEAKKNSLEEVIDKIDIYIDSIPRSELRIICRKRYVDGKEWVRVASEMNCLYPAAVYTEDSCRMKVQRFLEKKK